MSFFDIVDIFSNLFSLMSSKESDTKQPRIYILFNVLLAVSVFLFAIEIKLILNMPFLYIFLPISIVLGFILTIGIIILIYRLELIEILRTKDFFTILIPITLLNITFGSLLMS